MCVDHRPLNRLVGRRGDSPPVGGGRPRASYLLGERPRRRAEVDQDDGLVAVPPPRQGTPVRDIVPGSPRRPDRRRQPPRLDRGRQLLQRLKAGRSVREAARDLGIGFEAAKALRRDLFRYYSVNRVCDLVLLADAVERESVLWGAGSTVAREFETISPDARRDAPAGTRAGVNDRDPGGRSGAGHRPAGAV